jgi:hypothetical protein
MNDELVSKEELADQLGVPVHMLETATREEEWIRRKYPVAAWAVWDEDSNLRGYEVPEVPRRKMGLGEFKSERASSWWTSLLG